MQLELSDSGRAGRVSARPSCPSLRNGAYYVSLRFLFPLFLSPSSLELFLTVFFAGPVWSMRATPSKR